MVEKDKIEKIHIWDYKTTNQSIIRKPTTVSVKAWIVLTQNSASEFLISWASDYDHIGQKDYPSSAVVVSWLGKCKGPECTG